MEITAQVIADFRDWLPEFSNVTDYPDSTVSRALCIADQETGKRWGAYNFAKCSLKVRGMFAYAGHWLAKRDLITAATGAGMAPAASAGAVSGKSVGDESISYAVTAAGSLAEQNQQGDLSDTAYGQEFLRLRSRAAKGAMVV